MFAAGFGELIKGCVFGKAEARHAHMYTMATVGSQIFNAQDHYALPGVVLGKPTSNQATRSSFLLFQMAKAGSEELKVRKGWHIQTTAP